MLFYHGEALPDKQSVESRSCPVFHIAGVELVQVTGGSVLRIHLKCNGCELEDHVDIAASVAEIKEAAGHQSKFIDF